MGNTVAEQEQEKIKQVENKDQMQNNPAPVIKKQTYGWLILGGINFVFILLLAGGGLYLLQEIKDKQVAQGTEISKDDMREIEVSKQLNEYQSQLSTMQSQIATFNEEITGKDNHFTKTLADFSQLHTEKLKSIYDKLIDEISQVKRQLGKTRGDWLIADAEYLLSIANQRLHLMGDVNTTRMALEAADQRLRESGDTAAFKVREQIAKEIAGLLNVTVPDIVGMYSSVQLLKDKAKQLAVILPYAGKPLTQSNKIHDHQEDLEDTHGALGAALNLLEGYVTVRHSDQPVTEILTEEEVVFIRQQLNVKLEMIKISLVQQNDVLYKSNIADTKQWLSKNFTQNKHAKSFHAELDRLSTIQLQSQFPDISQSLKMLKDITKLRIESDKSRLKPQIQPTLDTPPAKLIEQTESIQTKPIVEPIQQTESIKPIAP
jgi:uroporphyrin-3 C-methyltransferase/uroporphyrinogen III methyltransferase/synthase